MPFRKSGRGADVPRRPINIEPTLAEKQEAERARYQAMQNCVQAIRDYLGVGNEFMTEGLLMDLADRHYSRLARITRKDK